MILPKNGLKVMISFYSSCIMTFGPKIYEILFHKTAGQAAFQTGIACVPGAVLGSFLGGVIAKVFKLTGRQMMYLSTLSAVIVLIFYTAAMNLHCDEISIIGVNKQYPKDNVNNTSFTLNSACNDDCTCTQAKDTQIRLIFKEFFYEIEQKSI